MNLTNLIQKEYSDVKKENSLETSILPSKKMNELVQSCKLFLRICRRVYDALDSYPPKETIILPANFELYNAAQQIVSKISFEKEDISFFVSTLPNYQKFEYFSFSGLFISALINKHYEKTKTNEEYVLITEGLGKGILKELQQIGTYTNGATIHVFGNLGSNTGENMISGKIIVEGNCGYNTGIFMQGGEIILRNAKRGLGSYMVGGKITCERTGTETGYLMEGGTIFITEHCEEIDKNSYGGKIYYKGEKIIRQTIRMPKKRSNKK